MPKKTRIEKLTPRQKARLDEWRDKYIAIQMGTGPSPRGECEIAVRALYRHAGLPEPLNVVFVSSPIVAVMAGSIASGVWHLREHPNCLGCATRDATMDATRDATRAATRAATEAATWAATMAATWAATGDATRDATRAATRAATEAATRAATGDATWAATGAATGDATRAATEAATEAATRAATGDATWAATWAATVDATGDATRDATRAATGDATEAATRAATGDATGDATWAATRAATRAATEAATRAATGDATWAATGAATRAATWAATRAATTNFLLAMLSKWYSYYHGGNQWSYWHSHLTFLEEVCGLELPIHTKFHDYAYLGDNSGPRMMHKKFVIIADRPLYIKTYLSDGVHVAHCDDGPSYKWSDGWSLWYLNGVAVDEQVVMRPETQTVEQIRKEENEEVKRIRIERFAGRNTSPSDGWARYLNETGATCVDSRRNDIENTKEALFTTADGMKILACACPSTGRVYALERPSEVSTCGESQSWGWTGSRVSELVGRQFNIIGRS